jgi:hypothetical protein
MPLSIASVEHASSQEWQRIADTCSYATFFHTLQWADIFSKTSGGSITPAARKVIFSDGQVALLPLSRQRRLAGLVTTMLSSPASTYGGWIAADPLSPEHCTLLVQYLLSLPGILWRENPFDPLLSQCPLTESVSDFTQVIDLRQLAQPASAAHRKALNKAHREGVTVQTTETPSDWQEHYRLYQQSITRWQKINLGVLQNPPYSWNLFESVLKQSPLDCKLWQAKAGDKVIASILCFYHNHHAVTWHGAADAQGFSLRPNNLLYEAILEHARRSGFWWMDFNPSGGHAGVSEFKANLGAVKLRSNFIRRDSLAGRILNPLGTLLRAIKK